MAASLLARTPARRVIIPAITRSLSSKPARYEGLGPNVDKPTHTGQLYEADDYRNIRFVDKDKLVNPHWAIDLIAEDPIVVVNGTHVWSHSCGPLGHPKVYINLVDKPEVGVCGYSGRKFIQKKFYDPAKHGDNITHEEYLEQMKGDSR